MPYQVSYIDTSRALLGEQQRSGTPRTEDYASEPAALARARELLQDANCHRILVSDGACVPVGGVRLQLKVGLTAD
jgi:hypothetical protein